MSLRALRPKPVPPTEEAPEQQGRRIAARKLAAMAAVLGETVEVVAERAEQVLGDSPETFGWDHAAAVAEPRELPRFPEAIPPRLPRPLDAWLAGPLTEDDIAHLWGEASSEALLRAAAIVDLEDARRQHEEEIERWSRAFLGARPDAPPPTARTVETLERMARTLMRYVRPARVAEDMLICWATRCLVGVSIERAAAAANRAAAELLALRKGR